MNLKISTDSYGYPTWELSSVDNPDYFTSKKLTIELFRLELISKEIKDLPNFTCRINSREDFISIIYSPKKADSNITYNELIENFKQVKFLLDKELKKYKSIINTVEAAIRSGEISELATITKYIAKLENRINDLISKQEKQDAIINDLHGQIKSLLPSGY